MPSDRLGALDPSAVLLDIMVHAALTQARRSVAIRVIALCSCSGQAWIGQLDRSCHFPCSGMISANGWWIYRWLTVREAFCSFGQVDRRVCASVRRFGACRGSSVPQRILQSRYRWRRGLSRSSRDPSTPRLHSRLENGARPGVCRDRGRSEGWLALVS